MAWGKAKSWRAKGLNSTKMHIKDVKGLAINIPTNILHIQGQFQQMEDDRRFQQKCDKVKRWQKKGVDNGYSWGPYIKKQEHKRDRWQDAEHEAESKQSGWRLPMKENVFFEIFRLIFLKISLQQLIFYLCIKLI